MEKKKISRILEEIGLMLELKGENPFKVRAYVNGARIIELLEGDLKDYIKDGKIEGIKGIGNAAGVGAKLAVISRNEYERAVALSQKIEYIELSSHPEFNSTFFNKVGFE